LAAVLSWFAEGTVMTHREFLLSLRSRLERAPHNGLLAEEVRAIRRDLHDMLAAGSLQPFASRLLRLLEGVAVLDGAAVAGLAADVRAELPPPRERTVVGSGAPGDERKP
jgi:hypothetical protein